MSSREPLARLESLQGLTDAQSFILEAYFALRRTLAADAIGSVEIRAWLRAHYASIELPSEALVRTILGRVGVPRRGDGRPSNESRSADDASPLLPVRRESPRVRDSRRK